MPFAEGSSVATKFYLGADEVDALRLGTGVVYDKPPPAPTIPTVSGSVAEWVNIGTYVRLPGTNTVTWDIPADWFASGTAVAVGRIIVFPDSRIRLRHLPGNNTAFSRTMASGKTLEIVFTDSDGDASTVTFGTTLSDTITTVTGDTSAITTNFANVPWQVDFRLVDA